MKLYRITFVVKGENLSWTRWANNLIAAWKSAEVVLAKEYCGGAELKRVEYVREAA